MNRPLLVRNDFDREEVGGCPAKDDFSGKSCAKIVAPRKWNLGQGFEHGTLPRGLITTDDELGKRQDAFKAALSDLRNSIENSSLLIRLQVFKRGSSAEIHGSSVSVWQRIDLVINLNWSNDSVCYGSFPASSGCGWRCHCRGDICG